MTGRCEHWWVDLCRSLLISWEIPLMNSLNDSVSDVLRQSWWPSFRDGLLPLLAAEDDPDLWSVAVEWILANAMPSILRHRGKQDVLTEIGRCSHWIRPHWKTKEGVRCTSGYDKTVTGFSWSRLPEFDWSRKWVFSFGELRWLPSLRLRSRRPLVYRIAAPARTLRHPQATVHAVWSPGSPDFPCESRQAAYSFEKTADGWRHFANRAWN